MWRLNEQVLIDHFTTGGCGLDPYYCLLPGAKDGWLHKELFDMFNYLRVLTNCPNKSMENLPSHLSPNAVVDFMRSVGFFPTDFEIRNLMREVEVMESTQITFEKIVQLYINHRCIRGTRKDQLKNSIYAFLQKFSSEKRFTPPSHVDRDVLMKILTQYGECLDEKQALMCLKELWLNDDGDEELDEGKLPQKINISQFIDNLLGLGLTTANQQLS